MSDSKYMPADGEPVDMSEFTLGERYGSEDMYREFPNLVPGSKVAFEKDGVLYTDTVQSVRYQSQAVPVTGVGGPSRAVVVAAHRAPVDAAQVAEAATPVPSEACNRDRPGRAGQSA